MRRSSVILGLLVASQAACMRNAVMPPTPTDYIIAHEPTTAWVTPVGGDPIKIFKPRVAGGFIVGRTSKGAPFAVRLEQVQGLRVRQLNPVPTVLISGGTLAMGVGMVVWRLTKPKSKTDCGYESQTTATGQFEADELGVLGACSP